MNFLVGNRRQEQILLHSHHHASQATIGRLFRREDFFHPRKTGFVHLEKLGLFPEEKLASIDSRWGSMLERRGAAAFLPRFLHFPKFSAQKVSLVGVSSCPLFAITLAFRPFFTVGIPFFYVFKCAAKSQVTT